MSDTPPFEPAKHLMKVQGREYLEVKWRLAWLRDRHPDARIETEMLTGDGELALFKATVWIPGGGSASGHGSETPRDYKDYYEKAETKAIGRALAALGFGTQFCDDHDFGGTDGRVVDAPVARSRAETANPPLDAPMPRTGPASQPQGALRAGPGPASDKQLGMLRALAVRNPDKTAMSDERWLHGQMYARFRIASVRELSKVHASALIDWFSRGDFLEPMFPTQSERVDPVEAAQQGLAQMPEEPAWLASAPGEDRYSQ